MQSPMQILTRNLSKLFAVLTLFLAVQVSAASGLIIHAAEFGVGKFHRIDNQFHAYGTAHAWDPYVLRTDVPSNHIWTQDNADGSVTIFFHNLDALMQEVVAVSKKHHQPVAVLNMHGHGLPGAMWFPKDETTWQAPECRSWRHAAESADRVSYDQYYSPVSKKSVMQIRAISNITGVNFMGCTTGLNAWKEISAKNPAFLRVLSPAIQVHFLSCVVGLGKAGDEFTKGMADLLLSKTGAGRIETSVNFGLGDWSMTKGMGFWDYISDDQIEHDEHNYPIHRRDSEVAQQGTIRMVRMGQKGPDTQLLAGRSFMEIGFDSKVLGSPITEDQYAAEVGAIALEPTELPRWIRIPGTDAEVEWTAAQ